MTLKRLSISQLRNIQSAELAPSDRVNLIFGQNGSGKTTILEAISILALGRSFRSHKHKALINHQAQAFTVFGRVVSEGAEVPVGVMRRVDGETSFKANGRVVGSTAELASYLPVQVINSDTFLLLEGSPKVRRQFMDWLVFHVEPGFFGAWKDAQRCLKHRNSLLRRDRIDRFELAPWDQELAAASEHIHQLRQRSISAFQTVFTGLLESFIAVEGIAISYQRGWDKERPYTEVLAESLERDQRQGFTHSGVHRADLKITVKGLPAAEVLSRGQQKLLVCALKIAQGVVFGQLTGRKCVYLVDDLPSELDQGHRLQLVNWLEAIGVTKPSADRVRVPRVVFRKGAGMATGFLRGLFTADGTVSEEGYPSLSSTSRGLMEDVQQLLLAVGVPSALSVTENRGGAFGDPRVTDGGQQGSGLLAAYQLCCPPAHELPQGVSARAGLRKQGRGRARATAHLQGLK
jgi:DNA replication and repair protein RecF